ncbi:hypothetical protein HG536_0A04330 [Torulaspora globosa]|uniref:Class E vacuolar protein-sorting machinery protein HSE1 n=1 Tax=Torulaspora globosa TaxID=48254 RepID=A0A7G3ZAS9_9SACH|nr:uncharacterized protein HG536_0A04330 [Torulaspora globosa]QLL30615.1 hypothetical protein HG536_0A04330 [Torulaspora globosa]
MSVTSAILRATDGNLRADNWQYILEVCDRVQDDPEDGGEEAIEVIEERLEQKDANVILRTLSLIVSLAENCGSRLKQLISSKRFTQKLQSLVENRSVHITVKRELAKVVQQLSHSFTGDPSLRYMGDLLSLIASKYPHLLVSEQPDVPSKAEMSAESKQKEDKELEEALKLSLVEYEQQQESQGRQQPRAERSVNGNENMQQNNSKDDDALPPGPTVVKKVRAMYDLSSSEPDELSFKKGDVIVVLEQVYRDWWRGTLYGKVGIFPLNYVTPVKEPTQLERELERQNENALLCQKANVDKLYYTLQRSKDSRDGDLTQDPAINDLYGTVTPLRPQIAKSIGKYARKREDLASLREVLANAEATYNQLLDRATNAYTSPMPAQRYPTMDQPRKGYAFSSEHTRDPHAWNGSAQSMSGSQRQNYGQSQHDQGYGHDYRKSQVPMQYGAQSSAGQNVDPYNPNNN